MNERKLQIKSIKKQKRNHKEKKEIMPDYVLLCSFSLLQKNKNFFPSLSRKPPNFVQDNAWQFS
jgi:hypothetical protein